MPSDKRVDVLIVGAGAAGLAAARDLSQAGRTVVIVEARPRVGGRVLTVHDPQSPAPVELGAEFVHGEPLVTLELARAARLTLLELPNIHEIANTGRLTPMRDLWTMMDQVYHDLGRRLAARGRDFPVGDYLVSAQLTPQQHGLLQDFVEGFYAAQPERLSAKSVAAEATTGGSAAENATQGNQFRIAEGYDALMNWLRDALDPDRVEVRLSTIAESIRWKQGGVHVTSRGADGAELATIAARTAIVTVPLALLKQGAIRFDPALAAKQRALDGLEMGQIFKIVLRFREAFWDQPGFLEQRRAPASPVEGLSFLHSPAAEVRVWWTALPVRAPLLTGWVGGVAAESLLAAEPEARLERTLAALSETIAVPRRELEQQLDTWNTHDWRADPFARGVYSYIGVGGMSAPRALARPVEGTLFFAGEATNGEQIGTVAGALESGRRAAREVLRALE